MGKVDELVSGMIKVVETDIENGILSKGEDSVSYWYVFYFLNDNRKGFSCIELESNYFDIVAAIDILREKNQTVRESSWVGIVNFQRICVNTYMKYKQSFGG